MSLITVYEMYCSIAIQHNTTEIIKTQAMKKISIADACTEYQHLRILECQCMYRVKVKQWHIHVGKNGNVIGKLTNVVLSVALPIHPPSSAEVKERVDLYLYSPSGTLLHVLS
jgi:hypothetical protein